jgi:serine/threonine protein kinase
MSEAFANRYDNQCELGSGAFGVAYLAHNTRLCDRPVALKILHPVLSGDPRCSAAVPERGWRADHRHLATPGLCLTFAVPCVQGVQENDSSCTPVSSAIV